MRLTPAEREVIITIADDETACHVFTDSARLSPRLLALAERWGAKVERLGEGWEFTLPLKAVRFATPRRTTERQRAHLQTLAQHGHFRSRRPIEMGSAEGLQAQADTDDIREAPRP